jgi:hypothetical protein
MASFSQISREDKRRIAGEIHDNLVARAAAGPADTALDAMIPKFATSRDALTGHVDGKASAEASRALALVATDIDDDEVDRWYRHIYRYTEVESLRRHAPEHASIAALLSAGYPDGLAHVDDRIPDQNEVVRKTLVVYRDPKHAATLAAAAFPGSWLDLLEAAVAKSDASFAAYQATFGDASTAVTLGRDAEASWVLLARALAHTITLRSLGAEAGIVEEGKRLMAPLTMAVRLLRSESRSRATKRDKKKGDETSKEMETP